MRGTSARSRPGLEVRGQGAPEREREEPVWDANLPRADRAVPVRPRHASQEASLRRPVGEVRAPVALREEPLDLRRPSQRIVLTGEQDAVVRRLILLEQRVDARERCLDQAEAAPLHPPARQHPDIRRAAQLALDRSMYESGARLSTCRKKRALSESSRRTRRISCSGRVWARMMYPIRTCQRYCSRARDRPNATPVHRRWRSCSRRPSHRPRRPGLGRVDTSRAAATTTARARVLPGAPVGRYRPDRAGGQLRRRPLLAAGGGGSRAGGARRSSCCRSTASTTRSSTGERSARRG